MSAGPILAAGVQGCVPPDLDVGAYDLVLTETQLRAARPWCMGRAWVRLVGWADRWCDREAGALLGFVWPRGALLVVVRVLDDVALADVHRALVRLEEPAI